MRRAVVAYPIVLCCLLSMVSCGYLSQPTQDKSVAKGEQTEQTEPPPLPQKKVLKQKPKKPAVPVVSEEDQHTILVLKTRQELNLLLENDDAARALSVARQRIEQGLSEQELSEEYLQALNAVIEQGSVQLDEDHPELAGPLLQTALNSYPQQTELAVAVLLTTEELRMKLNLCAKKLMAQGLIAYRAGELGTAIGLWEKILIFSPQHQASRKAIQTASSQLINLKKITDAN